MMPRIICTTALLLCLSFCRQSPAQEEAALRVIRWDELQQEDRLNSGEVIETDGPHTGVLKLEHAGTGPASFTLVEVSDPGISELTYAVTGQVRYEDVAGTSYLEMLNYFADGSWFFSRTLADVGPLASISGSSDWRDFQLPAMLGEDPSTAMPDRLVLNLHLEGPGTVYLSELRLAHIETSAIGVPAGAWWSDRTGGLVGGIAGSLLGLIGASIGGLTGSGRGRPVVMALLMLMIVIGSISLVTGIVALVMSQPYGVAYPLLLLGVLSAGLGGMLFPGIRKRFDEVELRRMQALDAG